MKKNAYTLNYWYGSNYGATLTSYALYKLLEQLGLNPSLVNNMNDIEEAVQNKMFSQKFLKNFNIIKNINSYRNLKAINNPQSLFLTGSDQVFRPYLTGKKLDQFLLDFVDETSLKIAISASFGVDKEQFLKETSREIIAKMKKSFESFDVISVREKSGVEICKDLFGVNAELIIDPVFIFDKQNYINIANKSKKDYSNTIATYIFSKDKQYKNVYKNFEKRYNAKVIELAFKNIALEDWLSAILNSKLVITDSFHGICFCLIFNKPFICPANGMTAYTRFDSLFKMLNIQNQTVSVNDILKKNCIFKIDYEKLNQRIEEERRHGLEFLQKVINMPYGKLEKKLAVRTKYLEDRVSELESQANLKYQIKKELWNLWLIIWHKYLPEPVKTVVRLMRDKYVRK